MRRCLILAAAGVIAFASTVAAKEPASGTAGLASLALTEVLDVAKPYPNLVLQVRLQLVRANLKREQVKCSGGRFSPQWTNLGGAHLAPYQCPIGKRTLVISAAQTFFDRSGRKLRSDDPQLFSKAATVKENGLTWKWK
jgi:hypothetical protein